MDVLQGQTRTLPGIVIIGAAGRRDPRQSCGIKTRVDPNPLASAETDLDQAAPA
jgi:hypothetical protein